MKRSTGAAAHRRRASTALAVLLLVVGLTAALAACGSSGGEASPSPAADDRVTVPDVAGDHLAKEEAEAEIKGAGLVPVLQTATSADVVAGSVIEQSPDAGEKVVKSSEVMISVSLGPKMEQLPELIGMKAKDVAAYLHANRLEGHELFGRTVKADEGICYKQKPGPGDQVAQGSTVTYWVSSGKPVVKVPNVVGMTESQAQTALDKKNLTYAGKTQKYSSQVEKGLVMTQSVPAGTQVVTGTAVELTISKGPHSTTITVPDCVGQQKNDVLPDLRVDGFQNITVDSVSSSQPAGLVIKQTPKPGTKIHPTEPLVLYVSKGGGGGGTQLTVPNCIGEKKNDVLPDLRLDGFENIQIEEVDVSQPVGMIVKQIPKPGVKIHPTEPLILYVSI